MALPKIGETISSLEFNQLPEVGETISAEQFQQLIPVRGQDPSARTIQRTATPFERARLSFGDARGRERFIKERGITRVNVPGLDPGDITALAGGALPLSLGIAGAGVGAVVGAPTGPGAFATTTAGAAIGGATGESIRQLLGKALGVRGNDTKSESFKDIALEGVLAGIAPGLGKVTTKVGSRLLGKSQRDLIQKTFNPLATTIRKFREQGVDLIGEWTKLPLKGNLAAVKKQVTQIASASKKQADALIDKAKGDVDFNKFVGQIIDDVSDVLGKAEAGGDIAKAKRIEKVVFSVLENAQKTAVKNGRISIQALQKLKRDLQSELGEQIGAVTGIKPTQSQIQTTTRKAIEEVVPDVAEINLKTRITNELIKVINRIEDAGGARAFGARGQLTLDFIAFGLGSLIGSRIGPVATAVGGPIALGTARKLTGVAASAGVRTLRARGIKALEKVPDIIPSGTINLILQAIQSFIKK